MQSESDNVKKYESTTVGSQKRVVSSAQCNGVNFTKNVFELHLAWWLKFADVMLERHESVQIKNKQVWQPEKKLKKIKNKRKVREDWKKVHEMAMLIG